MEVLAKVSVIMPVYNIVGIKRRFLKAVASVLEQTYQNLELLLVNDGSRDKSAEILEKLAQKDPRIRLIHKENGGVESARREGLRRTSGDFVMHMDQDDLLRKDAVALLTGHLTETGADVAVANAGRFVWKPSFSKVNPYWTETVTIDREKFLDKYYAGFFGKNLFPVSIWNKLYRKSFLNSQPEPPCTGLYNEDLSYNMHILPCAEKMVLVADTLYYYRFGGFTNRKIKGLLDVALSCYRIKMEQINKMGLEQYTIPVCVELMNYVNSCFSQIVEYDDVTQAQFVAEAERVMALPEMGHAVRVVAEYDRCHLPHINYMLKNDLTGWERHLREVCRKKKWKKTVKTLLGKLLS